MTRQSYSPTSNGGRVLFQCFSFVLLCVGGYYSLLYCLELDLSHCGSLCECVTNNNCCLQPCWSAFSCSTIQTFCDIISGRTQLCCCTPCITIWHYPQLEKCCLPFCLTLCCLLRSCWGVCNRQVSTIFILTMLMTIATLSIQRTWVMCILSWCSGLLWMIIIFTEVRIEFVYLMCSVLLLCVLVSCILVPMKHVRCVSKSWICVLCLS